MVSKSATTGGHILFEADQWNVARHVEAFAPTKNISLVDRRQVHAGWSLRTQRPVVDDGGEEVLIKIPWEHVLDKAKAEELIIALQRVLLMDGSADSDSTDADAGELPARASRRLLRTFMSSEGDALPEVLLASALLAARQVRDNPGPIFDGILSSSCSGGGPLITTTPPPLVKVAAETIRSFCQKFDWIHDVVADCGDLAIPLLWDEPLPHHAHDATKKLFCDAEMQHRVRSDVDSLIQFKASLDALWGKDGLLPRTLLPDDNTFIFGSNAEAMRYVAWIRSRWVCFLAEPKHAAQQPPAKKKKTTDRRSASTGRMDKTPSTATRRGNPSMFALCPLIEKLNHDSESSLCPTIDAGVSISIVLDAFGNGRRLLEESAGNELFISYGSHSNAYLLEHYGFMITPSYTNPAEVMRLLLPVADVCHVADRWHIAVDSLARMWSYCPLSPTAARSGVATVPVNVLFTVAVTRCLAYFEELGLISAPSNDTSRADDSSKGKTMDRDEDMECGFLHLGCLGEGNSDDSDEDGTSWFFDAERMRRFLAKKDNEISSNIALAVANSGVSGAATITNSVTLHGTPLTTMALAELVQIIRQQVIEPAQQTIDCISEWHTKSSTKEFAEYLDTHRSTLFWAGAYAEERRIIGEQMVAVALRSGTTISGGCTASHNNICHDGRVNNAGLACAGIAL